MPPKKRNPEGEGKVQVKKRKKKKNNEDSDDSDSDHGAGNGATPLNNEPEDDIDITLEGSMLSGEVLFSGGTNWDLIGRSQLPKGVKNRGGPNLWGPHRIAGLKDVRIRTVVSGCTGCHCVVITTEGQVYTWGRNEKGQLGTGDAVRRDVPTIVECLRDINIISAAVGKNHTLFLTDKGRVFACGDNKMGQLGLGHQSPSVPSPTRIQFKGPPIRKVACGAEFSMISDINGNLYSFGCPEYGQLGHNSDGKFFVTSNKLSFKCELVPRKVVVFIEKTRDGHVVPVSDVDVRDIACGVNHALVLDTRKRIFTWGFGGYGRLGHAEPKDDLVPRLLKFFEGPNRGASQIYAGSTYSMAVSELGALYLWGQTKTTGEAAMYPKLVHDLTGWKIRSVGCCNRSIVLSADESVISWGPSPTFGELGYGENKMRSSTTPQEVKLLDGVHVHAIACGYAHSIVIARCDTEEDQKRIERFPTYTP
ncbi:protein RCC2-like [Haliotis cracherodii]|uniref:protein RCC2-like n=1 Tax=Haliotis rufescens TaxID=6454 RepID=UPI001EB06FB5|nr:protein RCC2-like [Haliotis rufescens]